MVNPQLENGYLKIANDIYDALCGIRIPGEARQILDVIIRKTYGFGKKQDAISLSQFSKATGLRRPNVVRGIIKLETMRIIKKDTGAISKYMLNKNFEEWKPIIRNDTGGLQNDNKPVSKTIIKPVSKTIHTKDYIKNNITKDNIASPKKTAKRTNPLIKDFINWWCEEYENRFGIKYNFIKGKDPGLIQGLIRNYKFDVLRQYAKRYWDTEDDFYSKNGYSIGIFNMKINAIAIDVSGTGIKNAEAELHREQKAIQRQIDEKYGKEFKIGG